MIWGLTSCIFTQNIDNKDLPIDFVNLNKNLCNYISGTNESFEVKYDTNYTFKTTDEFLNYNDPPSFITEVVLNETKFYELWFLDPILQLKKHQRTTLLMYRWEGFEYNRVVFFIKINGKWTSIMAAKYYSRNLINNTPD